MSLQIDLNVFTCQIIYDVEEYFLQNIHYVHESKGYASPRCKLYSKYGRETIIQYLNDQLAEILNAMENDATLQDMNDNVFVVKAAEIMAQSGWQTLGHETFYETCAKIIVLGIFGIEYITDDTFFKVVRYLAYEAYAAYFLDSSYDVARMSAQNIMYTLFKLLGLDLNVYATPAEKEIGWSEIRFSSGVHKYINNTLPITLETFRSVPGYETMNSEKFDKLAVILLNEFEEDNTDKTTDPCENYVLLAVSVGFISYYSEMVCYADGVQKGIDNIIKLVLLEQRHRLITRLTNEHHGRSRQLHNQ